MLGFSLASYRATLLGLLSRHSSCARSVAVAPLISVGGPKQALSPIRLDRAGLRCASSGRDSSRNMAEVTSSLRQLDPNLRIQIP